jgi:hypothetical protein
MYKDLAVLTLLEPPPMTPPAFSALRAALLLALEPTFGLPVGVGVGVGEAIISPFQ